MTVTTLARGSLGVSFQGCVNGCNCPVKAIRYLIQSTNVVEWISKITVLVEYKTRVLVHDGRKVTGNATHRLQHTTSYTTTAQRRKQCSPHAFYQKQVMQDRNIAPKIQNCPRPMPAAFCSFTSNLEPELYILNPKIAYISHK